MAYEVGQLVIVDAGPPNQQVRWYCRIERMTNRAGLLFHHLLIQQNPNARAISTFDRYIDIFGPNTNLSTLSSIIRQVTVVEKIDGL